MKMTEYGSWRPNLLFHSSNVGLKIRDGLKIKQGWMGGVLLTYIYPFSYVAKDKIHPHNALGVFPQPIWGRSNIM